MIVSHTMVWATRNELLVFAQIDIDKVEIDSCALD